jgi:hypothetical protein
MHSRPSIIDLHAELAKLTMFRGRTRNRRWRIGLGSSTRSASPATNQFLGEVRLIVDHLLLVAVDPSARVTSSNRTGERWGIIGRSYRDGPRTDGPVGMPGFARVFGHNGCAVASIIMAVFISSSPL